jgi:hypothetical protein
MDEGHVVVDSIEPITLADITPRLARESGFATVGQLLEMARHGRGDSVYLIRFHYLPPGGWETPVEIAVRAGMPRRARKQTAGS